MNQPMPMVGFAASRSATKIEPGEQTLSVSLSVSFELEYAIAPSNG